jgi:hypothetical protein
MNKKILFMRKYPGRFRCPDQVRPKKRVLMQLNTFLNLRISGFPGRMEHEPKIPNVSESSGSFSDSGCLPYPD